VTCPVGFSPLGPLRGVDVEQQAHPLSGARCRVAGHLGKTRRGPRGRQEKHRDGTSEGRLAHRHSFRASTSKLSACMEYHRARGGVKALAKPRSQAGLEWPTPACPGSRTLGYSDSPTASRAS
jgi:hypothetical protein